MVLEADEILNEAIISGTPILIVEGIDDIQVYEDISDHAGKQVEVYAVENIGNLSEGCRGVIDCIRTVRENAEELDIEPYILGIIDRDARFYRNEIPSDDAILLLNWYSMESHFITMEATKLVIKTLTRASSNLLDDKLISTIHEEIKGNLINLFFISLEALKNSCEETYDAVLGYSDSLQEIRGRKLDKVINDNKKNDLIAFANLMKIECDWENLLRICKGKWLFSDYCQELKKKAHELKTLCETSLIAQCQFCINESYDKCLYKIQGNYQHTQIQDIITTNSRVGDFDYVRERISQMI